MSSMSDRTEILGMPLPFPTAEYERRVAAARKAMAEADLDAVLLFSQESQFYLFGFDHLGAWIYQVAVLTADDRPATILCRRPDRDMAVGLPGVGSVRVWLDDDPSSDPIRMTFDALADLGVSAEKRARVGIEMNTYALSAKYYQRLTDGLPDSFELVDASGLVMELRQRKSDLEVEYMRRAGEFLDIGYRAGAQAARPGVTELEVMAAVSEAMYSAGCEVPGVAPLLATGERTLTSTHGFPSSRVIQPNELFSLEIGGCARRYHTVGVQAHWIAGDPPADVARQHAALVEAIDVGFSAVRPGVTSHSVATRISEVMREHGLGEGGGHWGYGIGIGFPPTWQESLRIKTTDDHVLEPGMTFFLLTHHCETESTSGPFHMFVGIPVLVTSEGAERLTQLPLSLS